MSGASAVGSGRLIVACKPSPSYRSERKNRLAVQVAAGMKKRWPNVLPFSI